MDGRLRFEALDQSETTVVVTGQDRAGLAAVQNGGERAFR
jgi:hypothetical protein